MDLNDQEQISHQLDAELNEQTSKNSQLKEEISQIDELILKQRKLLSDQDNDIEGLKTNLADVQQRKKEEVEAF